MPKKILKINQFHGGINSDADPRDIKEHESPNLLGSNIDSVGRVKTLGSVSVDTGALWLEILPNKGLFTMGADRKIDGDLSDETFICVYDKDAAVDIQDSDGWNADQITIATTDPVYYSSDGILRVGDGDLGDSDINQWFGYIDALRFPFLEDMTYPDVGWYSDGQSILSPTEGRCLISNPEIGSNGDTINSAVGEYDGNAGYTYPSNADRPMDDSSVNLRVGLQYTTLLASDVADYTALSAVITNDNSTHFPIFGNNLLITGDSTDDDTGVKNVTVNFIVGDTASFVFAIYITEAELDGVTKLKVTLKNSLYKYARWIFDKGEITPDIWNYIVCTSTNYSETFDTFDIEDDITEYYIYFDDDGGDTTFTISGPVISTVVGLDGFQPSTYTFYYTYLYDNSKQESLPFKFGDIESLNKATFTFIGAPLLFNFDVYIDPYDADFNLNFNKRITGSRLYWKVEENDNYFLIGELDFVKKGFKWTPEGKVFAYNIVETTSNDNSLDTTAIVKGIMPDATNMIDTFSVINGFGSDVDSITAQYKTAVVHGRRTYIGNIRQPAATGEVHSDRILKSMVNKFDTFPSDQGILDVAIRDGESIVNLEAFADRILQFKTKSLYIINVSENVDFLEDVYKNKGCSFPYHTTLTDYGVAWFNKFGIYFYDGKTVVNLLEKDGVRLISESDWEIFITDGGDDSTTENAHIGYIPKKRQLLIKNENTDVFIYDFVLRAWMKGASKITIGYTSNNAAETNMTNFVLDSDQDLMYISEDAADIMTWNPSPSIEGGGNFIFQTQDIDFGNPGVRKKIYKVYVTYKCSTATNVTVKYAIDGNTTFNKLFQDGTNFLSNDLESGGDDWIRAELKPYTSSESNSIYSFALKFLSDGSVPADFEINDISIVYRIKNIK